MNGAALERESIRRLVLAQPPLLEGFQSLEEQLQPNGIDLTLQEVGLLRSPGFLGRRADERQVASTETLPFDSDGWLHLNPGPYLVTFNEVVNLPRDLMALGCPRSSLLRSGVGLHTAVWDAGYRGRSQALLTVHHPQGYRLQRDARLIQLVFFPLTQPVADGYSGSYQEENL